MNRSPILSVATLATLHKIRRAPGHEGCELALESLDYASAPALGYGLGCGIGENILFPFLQPIEDPQRRGLGRGLRYLEAAVHVCVCRAQDDGMDCHALP